MLVAHRNMITIQNMKLSSEDKSRKYRTVSLSGHIREMVLKKKNKGKRLELIERR